MERPDANELFSDKWPAVRKYATAALRPHLRQQHGDDVTQTAALMLWRQCLRAADPAVPPFKIDTLLMGRFAVAAWAKQRRRHRHVAPLGDDTDPAAPERGIWLDGVRLTIADAKMDDPRAVAVLQDGISMKDLAAHLGVSQQAVHQRRHELGGVQLPGRRGRWVFPKGPSDEGRSLPAAQGRASVGY